VYNVENVFPIPNLKLLQSDSWDIVVYLPGVSPATHTLYYALVLSTGGTPIILSSIAYPGNPNKFQLLQPSSITTTYAPGRYNAQAYIVDGAGNRRTLCETIIRIMPDLSLNQPTVDQRTPNEKMLDAIRTALANDLTNAVVEYSVGGRTFRKGRTELLKLQYHYEYEVRKEKGLQMGNAIYFRF